MWYCSCIFPKVHIMADACENIYHQSSPDRKVDLVRSYCETYDQLSVEAQSLK